MSFLAPVWLLGLLPWAAVVVWLLTGQHERTAVPFLDLWRDTNRPPPKASRAIHAPPLPVVLVLLATLLSLFAAARPRLTFLNATEASRLIFVIDRGFSVSTSPGWTDQIDRATKEIAVRFPGAVIERMLVPDAEPTLIDTQPPLAAAIQRSLTDPSAVIFAFTDQTLTIDNPRIIQIAPESMGSNVGIVSASASNLPRSQVMVRIRNDSNHGTAELKVGQVVQSIQLPARAQEKNYFVDVDPLDSTAAIELAPADHLATDNHVELARTSLRPRLAPDSELPPEVLRMAESYSKLRPPSANSNSIPVTARQGIGRSVSHILLPATDRGVSEAIRVDTHPIVSHIDWPAVGLPPLRIAPAPESDWRIIAWAGENPVVAVREAPARQVWIGFQSDSFPRSADFVVFWTNVFDWVGGGGERFETKGTPALPILAPPKTDWRARLGGIPSALRPGREITPYLALAALLMIFAAALFGGLQKLRGGLGSLES